VRVDHTAKRLPSLLALRCLDKQIVILRKQGLKTNRQFRDAR
jgi:hypothetical protein